MQEKDNTKSDSDSVSVADRTIHEGQTGRLKQITPDKKKLADLEDVASRARLQSTAGRGLGNLEKKGEPKQLPGESIQDFAARKRKFREEAAAGQKKAFGPASK